MKTFLRTIILTTGFLLTASVAIAQQRAQCDERAEVLNTLAKKYNETPIAVAITSSGFLIEVISSPKGQTWTIIMTTPQGRSCLMSAGEGWRTLEPTLTDPGA